MPRQYLPVAIKFLIAACAFRRTTALERALASLIITNANGLIHAR